MRLWLAALPVMLVGCNTPETQIASNTQYCRSIGVAESEMGECILRTAELREQQRAARAPIGQGMMLMSAALLSQPQPVMMPPPRQVRCTSNRNPYSGMVYTTCQ